MKRRVVFDICRVLLVLLGVSSAQAELHLSGIFSDHMVLQRDRPVRFWGAASAESTVLIEFADQEQSTQADAEGRWSLTLTPLQANVIGQECLVQANDEVIRLQDVLVGDIWHASGQSNMAMTMAAVARRLDVATQDMAKAKEWPLRYRRIREGPATTAKSEIPRGNGWQVASPESAAKFSAVAFYFARRLHDDLGVPIGIIDTSRGGTPIEPFIPREAFVEHPTLIRELELGDADDLPGLWKLPGGVRARDANWLPGRLFHSRLAPIVRFAVRGTIWYQAESNCGKGEDPRDYQHKMRALIKGWRSAFDEPEMPFYFVQLPGSGAGPNWPYMREQQRLSTDLPHTGMAVTIDLLDNDIHPPNKMDVGDRLARWALADTFGKEVSKSGPWFERATVEGETLTLHFSHAETGLMVATKEGLEPPKESPDAELAHFEIATASGTWYPAQAAIRENTVVVSSSELSQPVAVRYGYAIDPQHCYLYNRAGLPASPFCSDPALLTCNPGLPTD